MNRIRLAVAALALVALAACADGSTPTGVAPPADPSFTAGGFGIGAGNVVPTDTTLASTTTTTAAPDSAEGRGGFGIGAGN